MEKEPKAEKEPKTGKEPKTEKETKTEKEPKTEKETKTEKFKLAPEAWFKGANWHILLYGKDGGRCSIQAPIGYKTKEDIENFWEEYCKQKNFNFEPIKWNRRSKAIKELFRQPS